MDLLLFEVLVLMVSTEQFAQGQEQQSPSWNLSSRLLDRPINSVSLGQQSRNSFGSANETPIFRQHVSTGTTGAGSSDLVDWNAGQSLPSPVQLEPVRLISLVNPMGQIDFADAAYKGWGSVVYPNGNPFGVWSPLRGGPLPQPNGYADRPFANSGDFNWPLFNAVLRRPPTQVLNTPGLYQNMPV